MYIVRNCFGMIRVFTDYDLATDAYFEETAFCGGAELVNGYTGEVHRSSF